MKHPSAGSDSPGFTRRQAVAGVGLGLAGGVAAKALRPFAPDSIATPVIDVHCHAFNAADFPLPQFLSKVLGPRVLELPLWAFGALLRRAVSLRTPTVERELRKLTRDDSAGPRSDPTRAAEPDEFERDDEMDEVEWNSFVRELQENHGDEISRYLGLETPIDALSPEQLLDIPVVSALRRLFLWVVLMGRYRYRIFETLKRHQPEVNRFAPSIVDFTEWLGGKAEHPSEQLRLWEYLRTKHYPDELMPMGTFCPRRPDGLETLKSAPVGSLFGVKVYNPMGFRPLGNGEVLDGRLEDLYGWVSGKSIPILTHAKQSNGPDGHSEEMAAPRLWREVLGKYEKLRLCLGHGGGIENLATAKSEWARQSLDLVEEFPGRVFLGFSFSPIGFADPEKPKPKESAFFSELARRLQQSANLRGGICYGSDWHMIRRKEGQKLHPSRALENLRRHIAPDERTVEQIMGLNAQRLLGVG